MASLIGSARISNEVHMLLQGKAMKSRDWLIKDVKTTLTSFQKSVKENLVKTTRLNTKEQTAWPRQDSFEWEIVINDQKH